MKANAPRSCVRPAERLWAGAFGRRADAGRGVQARRDGLAGRTLCFQCYRAEIDRDRALKAAGELDTASVERFQTALPFEPVNRPRLEMLKVERATARGATLATTSGKFADRRRQAQIAARHALQRIAATLPGSIGDRRASADHAREMAAAIHAAELQLPESWLPFVVSRLALGGQRASTSDLYLPRGHAILSRHQRRDRREKSAQRALRSM